MDSLVMIGIAPFNWRLGKIRSTPRKLVYAMGPFRFSWHDLSGQ